MKKYSPYFLQGSNLLITAILGFIFLPIITNYLTVSEVGLYAQMLAIFSLGILITNSGTTNYNYRFLNKNNFINFKNSFITFVILLLVSIVTVTIYFYIFTNYQKSDYIVLSVLLVLFGLFKFFHSIFYANQLHKEFVKLNLLEASSRYTLALILVFGGIGYSSYFIANIFSSIIVLISILLLYKNKYKVSIQADVSSENSLSYTFKYVSLYTISGFSLWILTSIDILLIGFLMNDKSVGLYTLGYTLGFQIVTFILMLLNNVFEPKILSRDYFGEREILRLNSLFISLSVPLVVFVVFNSEKYFGLLVSEDFKESAFITNLIVFSSLFWGIFKLTSIKFAKDLKPEMFTKLVIIASGINIVLNLLLITKFGIQGAAVASIISYLFLAGAALYYVLQKSIIAKLIIRLIVVLVIAYLPLSLVNNLGFDMLVDQIVQLIILSLIYFAIFLQVRRKSI